MLILSQSFGQNNRILLNFKAIFLYSRAEKFLLQIHKVAEKTNLAVNLWDVFLVDSGKECIFKIGGQLNIFVLKGEPHGQHLVKTVFVQEFLAIKFGAPKLLQEYD